RARVIGGQAGEPGPLPHLHPARGEGHGVRDDVARGMQVAVVRAVRRAEGLTWRQRRVQLVDLARRQPPHVEAEALLHRHPLACFRDLGAGEARQHVPVRREARVHADLVGLPQVEQARPLAQPDRPRRATLRPHHAGRTTARALPERVLLEQHDPLQAIRAQEVRAPPAHPPTPRPGPPARPRPPPPRPPRPRPPPATLCRPGGTPPQTPPTLCRPGGTPPQTPPTLCRPGGTTPQNPPTLCRPGGTTPQNPPT